MRMASYPSTPSFTVLVYASEVWETLVFHRWVLFVNRLLVARGRTDRAMPARSSHGLSR